MCFASLVQAIDDLDHQLAVGWVHDALLIRYCIHMNGIFQWQQSKPALI
jgi:hypothetical protein